MKKVLITGGAGYIGSMLSTELVKLGFFVTVVDLLKYNKNALSHLYFFKNFKFIYGDARDKKILKKLIEQNEFIIPLAGLVGLPCAKIQKDAISTNYGAIKSILELVSKKHKIIYMTTNSGMALEKK